VTYQVFLSEKAQRDLDGLSDKFTNQILSDCARLADNPIPDGKRIARALPFSAVRTRIVGRGGDHSAAPEYQVKH
jgi:mRNA-degrading endonuclease RelE of RelBE toxin-antitoxin system